MKSATPGRVSSRLSTSVAVAMVSMLIFTVSMPRDLGVFDESIILTDAIRVLHGDIVHRDFYSSYGPAQYEVLSWIFKLFGRSFIAARLYDMVVRSLILLIFFYACSRQCSKILSLIFTFITGMWLIGIGNYLYTVFPCILLGIIATYIIAEFWNRKGALLALGTAGAAAGLTALFRYEVGFFLFLANSITIVSLHIIYERDHRLRRLLLALSAYGLGTVVVFLPVAAAYLSATKVDFFLQDIVDYSTKYYVTMRGLPFPGPQEVLSNVFIGAVYLPLVAVGLALVQVLYLVVRGSQPTANDPEPASTVAYLIAFGTASAMLFLTGLVRVSPLHMLIAIIVSLVMFAMLADRWWRGGARSRIAATIMILLLVLPAAKIARYDLAASIREPDRSLAGWFATREGWLKPSSLVTCRQAPGSGIAKLDPKYAEVATYLNARTQPDEPIFVGLDRHDKIFINPLALYFAAGRRPGTHWHQFDPGLQTRADIQAAIVSDLKSNRVRWVVRDASWDNVNEPNGSARSSGVKLLDHYLDDNFRPVAYSGKVAIWLARGETPIVYRRSGMCESKSYSSES